jgi:hypothetical protein
MQSILGLGEKSKGNAQFRLNEVLPDLALRSFGGRRE